jgi:hypothetical protein
MSNYTITDMTIHERFIAKVYTRSDINEHLPTLQSLAKECETIAEFGVRDVVSTWAFLSGLKDNKSSLKELVCVDIDDVPLIGDAVALASQEGINMQFIKCDSAVVKLPFPVDLLFIDTWHVYGHLKRELAAHADNTLKYIAMHDTEVDKVHGECLRLRDDIRLRSQESGYPIEEIAKGLEPAINEFLESNPEWELFAKYENNNGLTILKRK